jgi:hypothetical protein
MLFKVEGFYLGTTEKKYEFDGKKGTSIKVKTAALDGSGETFAWKVKEANHAFQEKLAKIPPMSLVVMEVKMTSVKDEAKLDLVNMAVKK